MGLWRGHGGLGEGDVGDGLSWLPLTRVASDYWRWKSVHACVIPHGLALRSACSGPGPTLRVVEYD